MKKVPVAGLLQAQISRPNGILWHAGKFILLVIILLTSCRQPETEKPHLLKLYGNGIVGNFSKNYVLHTTRCHMGRPGAVMASPGDILWLKNWMVVNEPDIKGNDGAIRFIESDSVLMLNGKIAGVMVDSSYNLNQLVDLSDQTSVSNLKILLITPEGVNKHRKELELIAGINPGLNLMTTGTLKDEDLKWLFGLFSPATLSIWLMEDQQKLLEGEQQLNTLFITNNDSIYHCTPLPKLALLRNLYFAFEGDEIASSPENKNWLKQNHQVKGLILTDWGEMYPKGLLSELEAPETLIIGGMDIPAGEITAHSKSLKRVILDSMELQLNLPALQTITVMDIENPQPFIDGLVKQKPDCEEIEIFAGKKRFDLTPLQSLKKLEALTLVDADSIDIAPLMQMKQLKLLSYSTDSTNMDSTIAVLQAALPNTVVVANEGLCLGSGWLMAMVPALLAAMGLAVYRKRLRYR